MLILFNADHENDIPFTLPKVEGAAPWERLFDTAEESTDVDVPQEEGKDVGAEPYKLAACSMAVFRAEIPKDPETNLTR
jgi:hypothetical protein